MSEEHNEALEIGNWVWAVKISQDGKTRNRWFSILQNLPDDNPTLPAPTDVGITHQASENRRVEEKVAVPAREIILIAADGSVIGEGPLATSYRARFAESTSEASATSAAQVAHPLTQETADTEQPPAPILASRPAVRQNQNKLSARERAVSEARKAANARSQQGEEVASRWLAVKAAAAVPVPSYVKNPVDYYRHIMFDTPEAQEAYRQRYAKDPRHARRLMKKFASNEMKPRGAAQKELLTRRLFEELPDEESFLWI